jgi:hypothetical protein
VPFLPAIIQERLLAKNPNPLSPVAIQLALNEQTAWYLDRLVEQGLYGNNRAEAAKIVIYDHCKLLQAQGKLGAPPRLPGGLIAS